MVMAIIGVVPILALSSTLLPLVKAYSFNIQSTPRQCQNLTVTITGDGGQAPYRLLIIPFGPSPLPNNTEVRRIQDIAFGAGQTTLSFQLRYPENSQFVAVVSDASGFGTGGTSVAATVLAADGAGSCFDASTNVSPDFVFSIEPPNQIVQCAATRIWWDNSTVQGVPSFLGIIPGGQSFSVPQGSLSNVPSQGTGFSWTPSVRAGTTLIIAGGDNRGAGSAGSSLNTVSAGINPNNDCLNGNSPSSTPGSPAGGSYPTNTSGAQVGGGGGGGSSNTGAIVGGVVGGVVALAALILALFFFRRRSQNKKSTKERPVDLLQDDDDTGHRGELPQYYQPEPYMMPEPSARVSTDAGSIAAQTDDRGRPLSGVTSTSRSGTPDLLGFGAIGGAATSTSGSSSGRKSGMPRPLRAVNIVQHEDAGPSDAPKADEDEPETIELPPAYTNIRSETPTRPA
ncbi:hypothetical protein BDN71DRAFT_1512320 [Pleurotus eryngii]|uniref:Epidermal growth factor receptor-like transmembrane-juxtamembrane segment domain-containing protein n=1 Tax=Pleurotus eryngii TaxID=5323 RepID=A0A9P5ZP03_PLEER|nr:hypothetical protein BDN71DRAFT_1512320 [Pleurotus eryngii]